MGQFMPNYGRLHTLELEYVIQHVADGITCIVILLLLLIEDLLFEQRVAGI